MPGIAVALLTKTANNPLYCTPGREHEPGAHCFEPRRVPRWAERCGSAAVAGSAARKSRWYASIPRIRQRAIRAIELIHGSIPEITIFAVGELSQPTNIVSAMRAGAREFLDHNASREALIEAFARFSATLSRAQRSSTKARVFTFLNAKGGAAPPPLPSTPPSLAGDTQPCGAGGFRSHWPHSSAIEPAAAIHFDRCVAEPPSHGPVAARRPDDALSQRSSSSGWRSAAAQRGPDGVGTGAPVRPAGRPV